MAAASRAKDFGSDHSVRGILDVFYFARNRLVKRRPAAMRVEFRAAFKQRFATGATAIGAFFKMEVVFAGVRKLGALLAQDAVTLRPELGFSLLF